MSIKSFSYSLAAVLLSSTSAFAMTCLNDYSGTSGCAGNQTPAGDCSTLGYSKANVDGCVKYLYCPFDTSYKRCITQKAMDCSAYPLTKCPDNGFCSECNDGSTTKYKLDRCETGYANVNNTCLKAYASCEDAGWKYSSIPANMHCDASTNIYLTNGTKKTCYSACSCIEGYTEDASGKCIQIQDTPKYKSCEDAGYFSSNQNRNCSSSTVEIQLTTGGTASCYTDCVCADGYIEDGSECVRAYASCEAAGYVDLTYTGMNCSGISTIHLTTGGTKECCSAYTCQTALRNGYVDVGNGCHEQTGLMSNCYQDLHACEEDRSNSGCYNDYVNCFERACDTLCNSLYSDSTDQSFCSRKCQADIPVTL